MSKNIMIIDGEEYDVGQNDYRPHNLNELTKEELILDVISLENTLRQEESSVRRLKDHIDYLKGLLGWDE